MQTEKRAVRVYAPQTERGTGALAIATAIAIATATAVAAAAASITRDSINHQRRALTMVEGARMQG